MKKLLIPILILVGFIQANQDRVYSYAHVYKSEPIYENRYERVYEQCEEPYYRSDYEENYRSNDSNSIGVDTLVGATLGVAIGNQIGKGNGRDVARVVGGLMGAAIANNSRDQRQVHRNHRYKKQYNSCNENYYTQRERRVLAGYRNYFTFENRQYTKVTKRPKNKIRVTKTISF